MRDTANNDFKYLCEKRDQERERVCRSPRVANLQQVRIGSGEKYGLISFHLHFFPEYMCSHYIVVGGIGGCGESNVGRTVQVKHVSDLVPSSWEKQTRH